MLDGVRMSWRYASGLRRFLAAPLSADDCAQILDEGLRGRERNFLRLVERAVFGHASSPYLALLRWAGVGFGDLRTMVESDGVESALEHLWEAGVHVSLDEFKGRNPIRRPGLELPIEPRDFDNPLLAREFEVASSGSTGPRRRMAVDFDQLLLDSAFRSLLYRTHGVESGPSALWLPVPPGAAGIFNALSHAKLRKPLEKWFSPSPLNFSLLSAMFTRYTVSGSRFWGGSIPNPEHVPPENALHVARWLAGKVRLGQAPLLRKPAAPTVKSGGSPAFMSSLWPQSSHGPLLSASVSSAVRVCEAARDARMDIAGTMFRVGGEPFTQARARLLGESGASATCTWSMAEVGVMGGGCGHPEKPDDVHVCGNKVALVGRSGPATGDLIYVTTLAPSAPKILLNVDVGDCGVLSRRPCGCLLQQAGFDLHLDTIRSYEKLTTGGMHFPAGDLLALVEEVLPAAHGGRPTDYQFVEETGEGAGRVSIVVSPRLGPLPKGQVIETILGFLGSHSRGDRMMAAQWALAGTLTVVRREPYTNPSGKVPPLHTLMTPDSYESGPP
jgi:hypothetical protein